jgi:hypothetical protein
MECHIVDLRAKKEELQVALMLSRTSEAARSNRYAVT